MTTPLLWDHVLVGLIAAYLLYAIFRGQPAAKKIEFDTPTKIGLYWTNGAALWVGAGAAVAVWLIAGRPAPALGLAWGTLPPVAIVLTVLFLVWCAFEFWLEAGRPERRARACARFRRDAPFMPATRREFMHFAFLATTAGVCEEIVFRGYLISYIGAFTGSSPAGISAAVVIPAVVFGVAHRYEGWKAVARIVGLAIIFGAIFLITKSLLVVIVLHVVLDLAAGVLTVKLLGAPCGPSGPSGPSAPDAPEMPHAPEAAPAVNGT